MASRILATVQCLMTTSEFVSTGCSTIVSEGVDTQVYRKCTSATRYTWYTMASKQSKILPARGSWMSFGFRDIVPLSFIKNGADETCVEGVADAVSLYREQ